jgi:hypothetical protein
MIASIFFMVPAASRRRWPAARRLIVFYHRRRGAPLRERSRLLKPFAASDQIVRSLPKL